MVHDGRVEILLPINHPGGPEGHLMNEMPLHSTTASIAPGRKRVVILTCDIRTPDTAPS